MKLKLQANLGKAMLSHERNDLRRLDAAENRAEKHLADAAKVVLFDNRLSTFKILDARHHEDHQPHHR